MTPKTFALALIACSFAINTSSSPCRADDTEARAVEKTETTTAAPAPAPPSANITTPSTTFAWPTTAAPVRKSKAKGVPNFGKLNDHVWRSGQPTKEGYSSLKELGVKTIVNLRKEFDAEKDLVPEGVKYVYIPIQDERAPTPEQAQQFLDVASDPANWPVLVHCHGGEGRAGVMSALVRFAFDGWDADKICKETDTFRVAHMGLFKTKMCGSQQSFLKQWQSSHKAGEIVAKFSKPTEVASSK